MQTIGEGVGHAAGVLNPLTLFEAKGDITSRFARQLRSRCPAQVQARGYFNGAWWLVNCRCNVMLKEVSEFANKLKKEEKDLKALSKAAETALEGSKQVLEVPLPNVYEDNAAAAAAVGGAARGAQVSVGGPGFASEQMTKVGR